MITESKADEMAEIRNVEAEEKRLKQQFPNRRIAKLHGKMSPDEKPTESKKPESKEIPEDVLRTLLHVKHPEDNA